MNNLGDDEEELSWGHGDAQATPVGYRWPIHTAIFNGIMPGDARIIRLETFNGRWTAVVNAELDAKLTEMLAELASLGPVSK